MIAVALTLTSIGLMYGVAVRAVGGRVLAAVAAVLLPLTPLLVHVGARTSAPVLFVLGWLFALLASDERADAIWLTAAGVSLGLGLYTGLRSFVMMPLFLVVTLGWLFVYHPRDVRPHVLVSSGFVVAALPLAIFLIRHPTYLADEITRLNLYDAHAYGVVHGLRELASWTSLTARSGIYYDYFNPAFLFLRGAPVDDVLRYPQMFLVPLLVLIPAGIVRALRRPQSPVAALILAGFVTSPAAAALMGRGAGPRIVFMVPFAVLLAVSGADLLLASRSIAARIAGGLALAAVPVCAVAFYANLA